MNFLDMNSEVCNLRAEEERILASFTRRLIEIAAVAGAHGSAPSPTAALNAMRLPAIALDQHGFVADVNAAADTIFDNDVKIKDRRLFVRDPAALGGAAGDPPVPRFGGRRTSPRPSRRNLD